MPQRGSVSTLGRIGVPAAASCTARISLTTSIGGSGSLAHQCGVTPPRPRLLEDAAGNTPLPLLGIQERDGSPRNPDRDHAVEGVLSIYGAKIKKHNGKRALSYELCHPVEIEAAVLCLEAVSLDEALDLLRVDATGLERRGLNELVLGDVRSMVSKDHAKTSERTGVIVLLSEERRR